MPRKRPFHVEVSAHPDVVSGKAALPRPSAEAWFEHWIPGTSCVVRGTFDQGSAGLRVNWLEITLSPQGDDDPGITAGVLGELNLSRVVVESASWLAEVLAPLQSERFVRTRRAAKATAKQLKRGRTGYPLSHYRHVARTYLRLQRDASAGSIYDRLAKEESRRLGREVPLETVRHWVKRAKEEQLLIARGRGQRGMFPGPRLHNEEGEGE